MALAQRLNELAVANSQGLLNDDEYRLLRQSVFEQHSNAAAVPVEAPVVPITRVHVQLRAASPTPRRPPSKPTLDQPKTLQPTLTRAKSSVNLGVANLIRRATGRKVPTPINDAPTNKDTTRKSNTPQTTASTPKRGLTLSRLTQKKPAELPPLRTDGSRVMVGQSSNSTSHTRYHPLQSPSSPDVYASSHPPPPASPLHPEKYISTIRDVFDDDNLETARDIRSVIAITEDEARRLIDAFNNLEAATLRRIQKQTARRLPAATPANLNVVLGGKEWREHRLVTSPSSPMLDGQQRQILTTLESNSDGKSLRSIRSGSSNRTSLSQSKSISSLPKTAPISPLSPHFRTPSFRLGRKNSASSTSSQGTSLSSSGMLGVHNPNPSTLSRSTSRLALHRSKESPGMASTDTIGLTALDDTDEDPELSDVRKRREDLINRYTARLEYLRARLKGAELHEKLLRK